MVPESHGVTSSARIGRRILVSLATYNERDNLAALIREICDNAPSADVLVIDDNSPDGTGTLAYERAQKDSRNWTC